MGGLPLDTLRSKYDANYLAEKVKKQQKAIVKTIDKQIDVKAAEVRHIQHMIEVVRQIRTAC